ncbi:MAG TPA: DEAD/DEAH box helicase [Anaerolineales bacterium]|nr:DEAD/DEAH box helicase [Anaerolineales bacterium]
MAISAQGGKCSLYFGNHQLEQRPLASGTIYENLQTTMKILHAHYEPPQTPEESGGILFWMETTEVSPPKTGRTAKKERLRPHPFCADTDTLKRLLTIEGTAKTVVLRLPAVKGIPLPSPQLIHDWNLDSKNPGLIPFLVNGIWLRPTEAIPVLLAFSSQTDASLSSAPDHHFWSMVAALTLETLAAHKLVPVILNQGKDYYARWLPILDAPKDAARLSTLEGAMPAICRAAPMDVSPGNLLTSFLNTVCDSLAREWGKAVAPELSDDSSAARWMKALFSENAVIKLSPAQAQSLAASHRAWMRNLHVAGDAAFRIAFRLEAPALQQQPWQLHYLIQAKDDPSLLIPAEEVWKKTKGALTHLGHRFEQPQEKLLAGLGYAARLFPALTESLKSRRPAELTIDTGGAYTFLRETAPLLEGAGFGILVPPWWNKKGGRLGVKVKMKSQGRDVVKGHMSFDNLVRYQWKLSLGETELTEAEFKALAKLKSPLVQIRGQWVSLDAEQIEAAIKFWEKHQLAGEMSLLDAMKLGLGGETSAGGLPIAGIEADQWVAGWLKNFEQADKLEQLEQPKGLDGQLRPYQRYGYSWLAFLRKWGMGACLADDMGLGKTIQTISLLLNEKGTKKKLSAPALLIAPTSVVTNWEREIGRFAPGLKTYVHRGAGRLKGGELREAVQDQDVVLTSYPIARLDAESFQSTKWLAVILDEAQNIKNPEAKQTQAIRKIGAEFRIALTGTPVENRLSELWSIMHFLNPGYLGARKSFRQNFALPIERYHDEEAIKQLKQLTAPFILRRVKTDPRVISDLPDKVETKVYCPLTEEQATLYEAVVQDVMKQIEEEEGMKRRGLVLSMMMQLKQICNHPVQYLHQKSKGSADVSLANRSGKLERLGELLEEVLADNDRALLFTQFAEMGEMLAEYLPRAFGAATQFMHGGTSAKMRDRMVKRFQEDEHAPPIFVLSLKAGGTGLNLTRANHVFHFDRWWNPAVENQATDRAFRIGQKRNVQVHKFVTTGTLEEMIDDMIESKKGLAQAVLGSGENWLTEMSTEELRRVVTLRRQ